MYQYLVDTNGQVLVSTETNNLHEIADQPQDIHSVGSETSLTLKPQKMNKIASIFTSKKKKNTDAYKLIVETRLQQLCSSL